MKRAFFRLVVVLVLGCTIAAQQTAPKPAPRLPSGKPDLSGVWARPYVPDMSKNGRNQKGESLRLHERSPLFSFDLESAPG